MHCWLRKYTQRGNGQKRTTTQSKTYLGNPPAPVEDQQPNQGELETEILEQAGGAEEPGAEGDDNEEGELQQERGKHEPTLQALFHAF